MDFPIRAFPTTLLNEILLVPCLVACLVVALRLSLYRLVGAIVVGEERIVPVVGLILLSLTLLKLMYQRRNYRRVLLNTIGIPIVH